MDLKLKAPKRKKKKGDPLTLRLQQIVIQDDNTLVECISNTHRHTFTLHGIREDLTRDDIKPPSTVTADAAGRGISFDTIPKIIYLTQGVAVDELIDILRIENAPPLILFHCTHRPTATSQIYSTALPANKVPSFLSICGAALQEGQITGYFDRQTSNLLLGPYSITFNHIMNPTPPLSPITG